MRTKNKNQEEANDFDWSCVPAKEGKIQIFFQPRTPINIGRFVGLYIIDKKTFEKNNNDKPTFSIKADTLLKQYDERHRKCHLYITYDEGDSYLNLVVDTEKEEANASSKL